jgi:hypothetical protein
MVPAAPDQIAEQELLLFTQQQVLWFDVTVNDIAAMGIVKSRCDLFDMGDDCCQWQKRAAGIEMPECSAGSIIHHQHR